MCDINIKRFEIVVAVWRWASTKQNTEFNYKKLLRREMLKWKEN